ncbi:unnamed protein product, partial [Closterium sp. Naga37s-1]
IYQWKQPGRLPAQGLVHSDQSAGAILSANRLQGTIPATFSALTALVSIDLSWNSLSGSIPSAFTTNIETLLLDHNAFSGPISPHLAIPSLVELKLSDNLFTGGISNTFTRLTGMTTLDVGSNSLSSGLHVVAQMTGLSQILLRTNNFSGVLPASLTAIKELSALFINDNHFTGTFSSAILHHKSLQFLDMSNNSFTGTIPGELTNLVNLQGINLNDNNFHGAIPSGLFQLSMIYSLEVANNFLSGGLPHTLSAPPSLLTLSLAGNGFTGSLPDFSRWNVSCIQIALNHNNFTGSIPDSISTLTSLKAITLNNNQLTGSIPTAIFSMTNLKYLYMANNQLSGTLPADISRLEQLEQIWLDNNNIEGPLPSTLCSLPWLWRIMMSNNYLYGPLPDCLFDKCVNQIDLSGNSLYGRINRNFRNMVADGDALINLAHNFFFGDAVLFAAGCQVCPTEITDPNNLDMGDTFDVLAGKCNNLAATSSHYFSVAGAGKEARVSLLGNCLTLSPDGECSSNATQRSTAACQAFCSITDNGPCDGHGACVPPAPASPSNFTCLCHAGYSTLDAGNGSTCAIVNSTTTTLSSLSTGAIAGIAVGCFAGFTVLAAVVAWLLWPRGQKKWEGLDVCEQFSLEQMVRAMASLHHSHLVRLLGFCLDQNVETGKQEQILVYEFVGNRDLDYHIHATKMESHLSSLSLLPSTTFAHYHSPWQRLSSLSSFLAWTPLQSIISPFLDARQARQKIEVFELDEVKDSKMPAVSEEAIVEFADLALDCMKSPGTRRPAMTEVAYRLTALIAKHCPDKEDEWESVGNEEGSSTGGLPETNVSAVSYGGRDSRMSSDSHPSASSYMSIGSIADGVRSWLHLKPTSGY